jgi:hypothetical protein
MEKAHAVRLQVDIVVDLPPHVEGGFNPATIVVGRMKRAIAAAVDLEANPEITVIDISEVR